MLNTTSQIHDLIAAGAIFYCSHSGGKDSQAMFILLRDLVPADQLVVVHADLGEIEWTGVQDHIRETVLEHEINVVRAQFQDGSTKDLLTMVERRFEQNPSRPCWPSSSARYCTSDLKRDPIAKFIRNDLKARGRDLGVNCIGLRAEESSSRAKKQIFQVNKRETNSLREVFDWLPIHHLTTAQVFQVIADAGEKPFWAYEKNERLSCVFCIFGCGGDLRHGAKHRPELAKKYLELEIRTGWTMFHRESLADKLGLNK
jgi:3'-phosphoadenosine 5'-phosphosulfate sulfotransferase (PAPS reductase)/FAD synthetase